MRIPMPNSAGRRRARKALAHACLDALAEMIDTVGSSSAHAGLAVGDPRDAPTAPNVADLLAHHLTELRGHMAEFAFALDAGGLSAPEVSFWTAWRDDRLAGFVALKQLDGHHGELKSMRAAPDARGTGVGRAR